MIDYSYLYKDCVTLADVPTFDWDLFFSAFNKAERVKSLYEAVRAKRKISIVHNEYGILQAEFPDGAFTSDARDEDEFILQMLEGHVNDIDLSTARICVDITGFLRPHLLFLLRLLTSRGVRCITALYAEPRQYSRLDDTSFGSGLVHTVRPVKGFEGISASSDRNDLLIIGAGFEDKLVAEVAEDKDLARKTVLLGLPSLKADMYQQSVIRTRRARDALGESVNKVFAPASDPFATATLLSELVDREKKSNGLDSLYLSPISTKPSALGFALYYIRECDGTSSSIIFPFSNSYSTDASDGIGRIWKYILEF